MLSFNIIGRVVALLSSPNNDVQLAALKLVGVILTGSHEQTQRVLDAGVLTCLETLLSSRSGVTRRDACWALSNITAGTPEQVQAVMAVKSIVQRLLEIIEHDDEEVLSEAAWALCNAIPKTKPHIVKYAVAAFQCSGWFCLFSLSLVVVACIIVHYADGLLCAANS